MTKYSMEVDLSIRNSAPTLEVELVGNASRVLDVGCATGFLGVALAREGRSVSGVEMDAEAAEIAKTRLDEVFVLDVLETPLSSAFAGRTFDAVVFGDFLEHMVDPVGVLRDAVTLLAPGGAVVVSVPNVSHGSLRLALLEGRWDYRETGLLDRTHVHFFDRAEVFGVVHDAGLVITDLYATVLDPLDTEVDIDDVALPGSIVEWVRHQPDAFAYQFVFRAVPAAQAAGPEPVEPVPSIELPMRRDAHTRRAEHEARAADELRDLRHDRLRERDAIKGLEAALGVAQAARARAEADRDVALHNFAAILSSRSFRLGQLAGAPVRVARSIRRKAR